MTTEEYPDPESDRYVDGDAAMPQGPLGAGEVVGAAVQQHGQCQRHTQQTEEPLPGLGYLRGQALHKLSQGALPQDSSRRRKFYLCVPNPRFQSLQTLEQPDTRRAVNLR